MLEANIQSNYVRYPSIKSDENLDQHHHQHRKYVKFTSRVCLDLKHFPKDPFPSFNCFAHITCSKENKIFPKRDFPYGPNKLFMTCIHLPVNYTENCTRHAFLFPPFQQETNTHTHSDALTSPQVTPNETNPLIRLSRCFSLVLHFVPFAVPSVHEYKRILDREA